MPQTADPVRISEMIRMNMQLRTGRRLGRTLYLATPDHDYFTDLCIGIVDSTELAGEIVRRWNFMALMEGERNDN